MRMEKKKYLGICQSNCLDSRNKLVKLTSTRYRRSVLVEGGLKIRCMVKVKMKATE